MGTPPRHLHTTWSRRQPVRRVRILAVGALLESAPVLNSYGLAVSMQKPRPWTGCSRSKCVSPFVQKVRTSEPLGRSPTNGRASRASLPQPEPCKTFCPFRHCHRGAPGRRLTNYLVSELARDQGARASRPSRSDNTAGTAMPPGKTEPSRAFIASSTAWIRLSRLVPEAGSVAFILLLETGIAVMTQCRHTRDTRLIVRRNLLRLLQGHADDLVHVVVTVGGQASNKVDAWQRGAWSGEHGA